MKKKAFAAFLFCVLIGLCPRHGDAQATADNCGALAEEWIHTPLDEAVNSFFSVSIHVPCLASVMPSRARTGALKALAESFGNSMQQSSPTGSSGSTSPVSKPAGDTSLIQDVGGLSATNNGSAFTLQFAPGEPRDALVRCIGPP